MKWFKESYQCPLEKKSSLPPSVEEVATEMNILVFKEVSLELYESNVSKYLRRVSLRWKMKTTFVLGQFGGWEADVTIPKIKLSRWKLLMFSYIERSNIRVGTT